MSIWNLLGLDGPTTDLKAIRKGYAEALRLTRPDEDPEGFMALRDAFTRAKQYAAYQQNVENTKARPKIPQAEDEQVDGEQADEIISKDTPQDESAQLPPIQSDFEARQNNPEKAEPLAPIETDRAITKERKESRPTSLLINADKLLSSSHHGTLPEWQNLLEQLHNLSLDDYSLFERHFREIMLKHYEYYDPKPRRGAKNKAMKKDTAAFIFRSLGWDDWKHYPIDIQPKLLYLLLKAGFIKPEKKPLTASQVRRITLYCAVLILLAITGIHLLTPNNKISLVFFIAAVTCALFFAIFWFIAYSIRTIFYLIRDFIRKFRHKK